MRAPGDVPCPTALWHLLWESSKPTISAIISVLRYLLPLVVPNAQDGSKYSFLVGEGHSADIFVTPIKGAKVNARLFVDGTQVLEGDASEDGVAVAAAAGAK